MDEKKPSRKKKVTPPKDIKSAPVSENEELIPLSKIEKINIEKVFAQALDKYKDELLERKKVSNKELSHLGTIVEEYLSCFVIVGFSLEGEKICLFNAQNDRDEGALVDHLRSTFIDIANNRP